MFPYDFSAPRPKKDAANFLVPAEWGDPSKRPRGIELKNGVYYMLDAGHSKNTILFVSEEVLRLKELTFFLIWRYQKTYTREYFQQLYGAVFQAFQDYLDVKRSSLEGIPGLFNGIVFGDKQHKFKQTFYVEQTVPIQFQGAKIVSAIVVDRIQGPSGNIIKNPQDMANAYKELKTIFLQELDYMEQNEMLK